MVFVMGRPGVLGRVLTETRDTASCPQKVNWKENAQWKGPFADASVGFIVS